MRGLSANCKASVAKLFLSGLTYDEIATRMGIGKGSVVNIIEDFRNGRLPIPPSMSEYVDGLRHLVVDIRKHRTAVAELMSYLVIHRKLKEMGVATKDVERWLEACQELAASSDSDGEFVRTVMELSRLSSETGLSYSELLAEYQAKVANLKQLKVEIAEKARQLDLLKIGHKEEIQQARRGLEVINKAAKTAQENFNLQRGYIKSQLDEYITQRNLTLQKVETVMALFENESKRGNLTGTEIERLSRQIRAAASLAGTIKELENRRLQLQAEVDRFVEVKRGLSAGCDRLVDIVAATNISLRNQEETKKNIEKALGSLREEYSELVEQALMYKHNNWIARLILHFLSNPKLLNQFDFNQLLGMMMAVAQVRQGKKLVWKTDSKGYRVCECPAPFVLPSVTLTQPDIDTVREMLAYYLAPLVKEKFVTKAEYEGAIIRAKFSVLNQKCGL